MKLDVQTHFSQGWNTKLIEQAKQLGIEEIRDSQPWGAVETKPGQYVFPSQLVQVIVPGLVLSFVLLLVIGIAVILVARKKAQLWRRPKTTALLFVLNSLLVSLTSVKA